MRNNKIFNEKFSFINKIHVPSLSDPINLKIYWFQAHTCEYASSVIDFSHVHTFNEAHFIINGNTTYDVNGELVTVFAGEFIMISKSMRHTQISCSDDLVKISLSFEVIPEQEKPLSLAIEKSFTEAPVIHKSISSEMASVIDLICVYARKALPLAPYSIRNEIFSLVVELYYISSEEALERSKLFALENDTKDSRYILAKKFIDDNIYLRIKTEDVANHVHLSAKQLNRIFLKHKEMTVFDYISEKKTVLAKELLTTTDLPIRDISDRLGFADEFYFNKYFTKKAGITPMKFRKINGTIIKNKEKGENE